LGDQEKQEWADDAVSISTIRMVDETCLAQLTPTRMNGNRQTIEPNPTKAKSMIIIGMLPPYCA
jgi:hypothetical protein